MSAAALAPALSAPEPSSRYKWSVLFNTTLGVLLVSINESILIIALPDIFRGIHLNPLVPANSFYLLWILLGFMLVTAVLVVTLGRIGDIYGRVKMYNLGFAVFTVFSILLSINWLQGDGGGMYIVVMRIGQGVGGAFIFANSSAILTDAFPNHQRGMALGVNQMAGIAGIFIGLVVGGLLAPIEWRLVFVVSAPFGALGAVWAYVNLRDNGLRTPARIDWWGNILFALGLTSVLVGITYGIQPYGTSAMGWGSPRVITELAGGVLLLVVFGFVERKVKFPMFRLDLFRIRAFLAGNIATLFASIGRGGLMFLFVLWLQGIWLPLHGYSFTATPLWAGIYMLPLTAGFLVAGPVSGILSDRFGARPFATGGMAMASLTFVGFALLPVNFSYLPFALLMVANGLSMGLFSAPNRAAIMNAIPADQRGSGSGMTSAFQNSSLVLSMGIFFTLMISGIAAELPASLYHGLVAHGVSTATASHASHLPPITSIFASLLGYDPIRQMVGASTLAHLPAHTAALLSGRTFFPSLLSKPFSHGLTISFVFGAVVCALAAVASLFRGPKYLATDTIGDPSLVASRIKAERPVYTEPVPVPVGVAASNGAASLSAPDHGDLRRRALGSSPATPGATRS